MHLYRPASVIMLITALGFTVAACSEAPTPTAVPTPTRAAPTPPTTTQAAPTATRPAAPAGGAPAAGAPPAGASLTELTTKSRGVANYTVDMKIAAAGQTMPGKGFIKGNKVRQEVGTGQQQTVILMDFDKKTAFTLLPEQNLALPMDFDQMAQDTERPTDLMQDLGADAKFVGTETVDGKQSAIYETSKPDGTTKVWVWIEKGLPLKIETQIGADRAVVEFTNYQFTAPPDDVFELPTDVQFVEVPSFPPGGPEVPGAPAPGAPQVPGAPGR